MVAVVALRWSAGLDAAVLGETTGRAELAVTGPDSRSAIALVDAVLEAGPGPAYAQPGSARFLAVADRDRLLVRVHQDLYGDRIATTRTCRGCGERFDLEFRLDELVRHCEPDPAADRGDSWRIGDLEFRPLTGDDELAVLGDRDPAEALFRRVTTEARTEAGAQPDARPAVGDALGRLAPPVAAPIGAECPECGSGQSADFDVQGFLLARILGERARLWRSVHLIAATYHWPRADILALGRRERETYVEAITAASRARLR
jgi:hypothetical protein